MTIPAAILVLSTFSAAPAGWIGWDDYGSRYALQLELRPGKAYYVSRRRGDDSAEGVDIDSPLRSLTRACELAEPGDTVIVAPGVYRETLSPAVGGRFPDHSVMFYADRAGRFFGEPGDVVVAPRPNRRARDNRDELVASLLDQVSAIELIGFSIVAPAALGVDPAAAPADDDSEAERVRTADSIGLEMIDSTAALRACRIVGFRRNVHLKRSLLWADDCAFVDALEVGVASDNSQCSLARCSLDGHVEGAIRARTVDWSRASDTTGESSNERPIAPLRELERRETSLRLDACAVRGGRGPGVVVEATRGQIENCEIAANAGDAVRAERVGELIVRRSRIVGNQGRGLFLDQCLTAAVEQTSLLENGDWAVLSEGVDLRMTNCLIARNAFGVSIASPTRQTTASLWQLTVADNRGEFVGSRRAATATFHTSHYGVLLRGGELELVNSMVTGNGQYGLYRYGGFVRHHHNLFHGHEQDFYGSELGADEYIADPRYRDREKSDYQLQRTSRGVNQAIEPGARATEDLDGRPRPLFRRSDLGCFESTEQPGVRAILKWQELAR